MSRPRRGGSARRRWSLSDVPGETGEPVPVGDAVAALGAELGLADPRILGVLTQSWGEIVGPVLAAHARLRSVRAGVLTIGVDSGPWATQVRYLEADLLSRVAALVEQGAPHAIRVVVEDHPGTEPRR